MRLASIFLLVAARKPRRALGDARTQQRQEILRRIAKTPGIGVKDLAEQLPFQWSSLYHHLQVLTEQGLVRVEKDPVDARRRRLFPGDKSDAPLLPHLSETARRLARRIAKTPGLTARTLHELEPDVAERIVYHHLHRLLDAGLIYNVTEGSFDDLRPTRLLYQTLRLPEPKDQDDT